MAVVAVLRALRPWSVQETIHTDRDVKGVWSRRALGADRSETVMVAGQGTEEVWLWAAAIGRTAGAPVADFVGWGTGM